jgi:hypothetical protein
MLKVVDAAVTRRALAASPDIIGDEFCETKALLAGAVDAANGVNAASEIEVGSLVGKTELVIGKQPQQLHLLLVVWLVCCSHMVSVLTTCLQ